MAIFCGICEKEVVNWKEHVKSKEHLAALSDPKKIKDIFNDYTKEIGKRIGGGKTGE